MVRAKSPLASSELLTLIAIVMVIAILYFAREILVPLALAVLLSFLLTPVVTQLEKIWLGRIAAVEGLNNEFSAARARKPGAPGSDAASETRGVPTPVPPLPVKVEESSSGGLTYLRSLVGPLASVIARAVIVIVFTLFMLAKREDLRNRVLRLAGKGQLNVMTRALDDASQRISRYLFLQLLVNSSYGILFGLGLYLIGIPHALLWGVFGGILRFIPYFGTLIGAIFPIALALAVFPGWSHALYTLELYLVIELTIANVMEPWLYGVHTGISPFAILVAAVFWATLWGQVGLILSVPLTVCLMALGRHIPHLEFVEILLGDEPVLTPEANFYQRLLAMDLEEARDIAQDYLKEKPLGSLYDCVFIPALSLAEQDRHSGALDEERKDFIWQSAKELIEEFGECSKERTPPAGTDSKVPTEAAAKALIQARLSGMSIVCVPARDKADEMIALMLAQLLQCAGYDAQSLAFDAVENMLGQVLQRETSVACVSALPPFALGQAGSLCRRLCMRAPELKIVLGLWNFEGGISKAQERVGAECVDRVVTTLADAMGKVRQLAVSTLPVIDVSDPPLIEEERQ